MNAIIDKPSRNDQTLAREMLPVFDELNAILKGRKEPVRITLRDIDEIELRLPVKALEILEKIMVMMADGKAFSLIPADSEVSTQQAAEMLSVSRPHLIKMLEDGALPYRKVGSHRRIRVQDLMTYMQIARTQREKALEALARQAQDLNMGY